MNKRMNGPWRKKTISHNTLIYLKMSQKTGSKVTRWCITLKLCMSVLVFGYFQVIRQLCSACVSWVHGDEHTAGRVERELGSLEHKRLHVSHYGLLNTQNLLSDHRQHLHLTESNKHGGTN